jgi:hypothetical protein
MRQQNIAPRISLCGGGKEVRDGLFGQDHKLLSPIYRTSFIFFVNKKEKEMCEDLKLNKEGLLDAPPPPLPAAPITHHDRRTEVLPQRRCRMLREGVGRHQYQRIAPS